MGVVRTWESRTEELEAFRRQLVAAAGIHRRKDDEGRRTTKTVVDDEEERALLCVTSGVSYLGLALVNHLLLLGYSVRIIIHNPGKGVKLTLFFLFPFSIPNFFSIMNFA